MKKPLMTPGQLERIKEAVGQKLRSLSADRDSAQRIIRRIGDLGVALDPVFLDLGGLRYRNEEVESTRGYPANYQVKPICEQLFALSKYFPDWDTAGTLAYAKTLGSLPKGAEGWFAIPKYERTVSVPYSQAVEKVLGALASQRQFYNWQAGKLGEKYLRQSDLTKDIILKKLAYQTGDFYIVAAQFGKRHAGKSVRRAREVFEPNEFGLRSFDVACMLLSHPERFQSSEDLFIDCPGDEYDLGADGRFLSAPCFGWRDGVVGFRAFWCDSAHAHYGSASGFLP